MLSTVSGAPLLVCTTAGSLEGLAFCRHALESGEYRVRALVRNPESARAKALEKLGADVWVADNLELDSLTKAFTGAHGLYAVTTWSGSGFSSDGTVLRADNLDAQFLEENEFRQGLNILEAIEQT